MLGYPPAKRRGTARVLLRTVDEEWVLDVLLDDAVSVAVLHLLQQVGHGPHHPDALPTRTPSRLDDPEPTPILAHSPTELGVRIPRPERPDRRQSALSIPVVDDAPGTADASVSSPCNPHLRSWGNGDGAQLLQPVLTGREGGIQI